MIQTLTIVGVGLIGGSIGLAAKRRGIAARVVGAGRNAGSLERARSLGAIDECCLDLSDAVRRADFAVFCTPVDRIVEQVLEAAVGCAPGTILTDAGSTKTEIVHGVEGKMPKDVWFVGSHPLAGSEKRGPEHAEADLFQDRLTIVTPTPNTHPPALDKTVAFWNSLGCQVRKMEPEEHDRALALTSHLPHLAASALAGILRPELFDLTATGYRDTTRVAAGDPSIWTGIFMQNRSPLLDSLQKLLEQLDRYRIALEANDAAALDALLLEAKKTRDSLDGRDGQELQ